MSARPRPALGILFIAVANALGGASFPMQALALEGLGPGMVCALRQLIALPLLWAFARARGASFASFGRRDHLRLAFLGVVAFGLPMLLGNIGVGLASASNGAILILIEPVTILLFAHFLLRERVGQRELGGVLLGLVGALCIVLESASTEGLFRGERFAGNLVLAAHALLWGLYTPLVRSLSLRHDTLAISTLTVACSLFLVLPYGLVEAVGWSPGPGLPAALWWSVGLGVGVSFTTTVLWVGALRHIEASLAAPFVFLQPVFGVLCGVLFLGERLSAPAILGAAFVALGCALALGRARAGRPPAEA